VFGWAGQHANGYRNARWLERLETTPAVHRVRIAGPRDHAPDAGGNDGIGAGRGATVGAARFQRYVKRGAGNPMAFGVSVAERLNFGVRLASAVMPALANDGAFPDQDGADHGIGGSPPLGPARQAQCQAHESSIGWGGVFHY